MNQILKSAPGTFGKLVALATLCRCRADEKRHPEFDDFVPPCLASLVLRSNHERVFSKWLELVLEEQWKEISEYLAARAAQQTRGDEELGDSWESLIPQTARDPERALFLADLDLVLSLVPK